MRTPGSMLTNGKESTLIMTIFAFRENGRTVILDPCESKRFRHQSRLFTKAFGYIQVKTGFSV
jgi:hypothetical protein